MSIRLKAGDYSGTKIREVKHPDFSCSITSYSSSDFNSSRHYHPNTHLSFVLKGGCEEQKQTHYERKPLSTTFYYPGEEHQINHMAKECIHVNIEFAPSFFKDRITEEDIALACKNDATLPLIMARLYKEIQLNDDFVKVGAEGLVLSLPYIHQSISSKNGPLPHWVMMIKDYLHNHWNRVITLDELSVICGVHKVTLSKYFPKYMGCSLTDYQRKIRISNAMRFIDKKNMCLTEIALACGFADQSHFIRFFKKFTGFLPKQFEQLQH